MERLKQLNQAREIKDRLLSKVNELNDLFQAANECDIRVEIQIDEFREIGKLYPQKVICVESYLKL